MCKKYTNIVQTLIEIVKRELKLSIELKFLLVKPVN